MIPLLEKASNYAMPALVVLFAATSYFNLREAQSLRADRSHRFPQFSAGKLPTLLNTEFQVFGSAAKLRLSSLSAPILAVYFVKANDCLAIIPEVEDVTSKFGGSLNVAVFAFEFNAEERNQLQKRFSEKQLFLECGECKELKQMHLPATPLRLLIDRNSGRLLLEERPSGTKEERTGLLISAP